MMRLLDMTFNFAKAAGPRLRCFLSATKRETPSKLR